MKLYAACLASYNSGRLYGAWIDASADADEMRDAIATMLRGSPCPNVTVTCPYCDGDGTQIVHNSENGDTREEPCATCAGSGEVPSAEEWAIHDYDGFPDMGEYPNLDDVAAYVELVEDNDSIDADDMKAIMGDFQTVEEAAEALRDSFSGIYSTFRDYADEAADEMISCRDAKPDSILARYFDYEAFARDLAFDMRVIDCPSGVAVFYA